VSSFFNAVEVFFDQLTAVKWTYLGWAVFFHLARLVVRTFAWRNILAAAYPGTRVRLPGVFGAYVAGVGVNAIFPARAGDLVKLMLAKRRIEGSHYPTLGSTLLVETLFDFVVAVLLFLWALQIGALPGLGVLPDLPSLDFSWAAQHPRFAAALAGVVLTALTVLSWWGIHRVRAFWQEVGQGLAILRDRTRFVRGVVTWQATSWGFRLASAYFFLKAFSIPAGLENALLVLVVQGLSTMLPFTPAGAGTEQALIAYVFRDEATTSALLSFSVGMKIAIVVVNAALGFAAIGIMLRTFRWRRAVGQEDGLNRSEGVTP
jgi:uncharacterized membrane protein YbhN (UPF0104 family)